MEQTAFTIRMDKEVKKRFDELCKDFGMSANTAFNIFARAVIRQERIPFDVESERQAQLQRAWEAMERMRASAVANGIADMPMEEIDEEISKYREERKERRIKETPESI
ncbi:MAG: type II toxin-antitoxin system RelB/DinJ family antitoxin [Bacteroidales bacterium]|nr:type II toxin-antitoxin system RelB/DinJ family antitoxin [Bacteroidales bacterium]